MFCVQTKSLSYQTVPVTGAYLEDRVDIQTESLKVLSD